ncbi:hypothetical protein BDZ89DRAFT_1058505 [Hymenopellis radicata]|nr:hypothetical protein BDZ89DRAFT_1058505 [Hymenopellis radicata]
MSSHGIRSQLGAMSSLLFYFLSVLVSWALLAARFHSLAGRYQRPALLRLSSDLERYEQSAPLPRPPSASRSRLFLRTITMTMSAVLPRYCASLNPESSLKRALSDDNSIDSPLKNGEDVVSGVQVG